MAEDLIRYDILAQDALRGVVRKVLSEVAKTGLPGEHHFYITFATKAPGVRVSSRLLSQYPEDMTIVLQHQFWDLGATEHGFEVGLSFNGIPERVLVPYTAVKAFVDPSVQFALQFEPAIAPKAVAELVTDAEVTTLNPPALPEPKPAAEATGEEKPSDDAPAKPAQVVSLDSFRKKS